MFHCLLGLLSVTGLRIAEALNLQLHDVDLDRAVLTIRAAKHGRSRLVPLHPSTVVVLGQYLRLREQVLGARGSEHVFVSNTGGRLDGGAVHRTFYALSRQVGLRALGAGHGPRLHDLRHNSGSRIIPGCGVEQHRTTARHRCPNDARSRH
jgi:integrase